MEHFTKLTTEQQTKNKVYEMETAMWEAAKNRNSLEFLNVVAEDAVMVCGGRRCSGREYADIVFMFDCKSYRIEHFEVVNEDERSVQVHYVIHLEVNDERNSDLAGTFHITTTWADVGEVWKVVFNMDQRMH